ncbi:MAG: hypothetical protein Q9192_004681, partial [Flavoplaca navasiana]
MASPDVVRGLQELEKSSAPQQDRPAGYKKLLDQILSSASKSPDFSASLGAFIDSILGDNLGIVAARPLLSTAVYSIRSIPSLETQIEAGTTALRSLEPRIVSFEEQDAQLREILADAYQSQEEYIEAAKVLQ